MSYRTILAGVVALVAAVSAAAPARAGTLVIDDTPNRTGVGGEFKVTGFDDNLYPAASGLTNAGSGNAEFTTFCLEYNETISLPGVYDYTIDYGAVNGGVSGQTSTNYDPIDTKTAKLYYAFWTAQFGISTSGGDSGSLTDVSFDYGNNATRGTDGKALQEAIWYLEGERTIGQIGAKAQDFVTFAGEVTWSMLGQSDWSGVGLVRVLNLTQSGTPKQSQLVVVPLPAGALMGLALFGALGVAARFRARRRGDFA